VVYGLGDDQAPKGFGGIRFWVYLDFGISDFWLHVGNVSAQEDWDFC
jgi:hypothetical protein